MLIDVDNGLGSRVVLVEGRGGEHVVSWLKRLLVRCGLGLVLTFILWRGLAA